jgi:glucan phosphoethanolaminetransferase (alkaline phosphatase superfamily)
MRWLLFLSRVAFIFGIFILIEISRQIRNWTAEEAISSSIITMAAVLGLVFIPAVNICYLVVLIWKRKLAAFVPRWLIISNLVFLLLLLFYIFYLNDPYYNPQ